MEFLDNQQKQITFFFKKSTSLNLNRSYFSFSISSIIKKNFIGKHITKCIPYKAALYETYNKPGGPNVPEKRTFLESHFSILAKNLYNYYDRITVEGTYINNLQPDLNVQVPHKNCKFLCKCLSKPAARADSFPEI